MIFTFIQINNWKKYEKVRMSGRYNMWFPEAQAAAGLSKEDYIFCIKNYSELREAASKDNK